MLDPYKLVFINTLIVTMLGIVLGCYRFIYPRRKISPFVLLIILSTLPLISIFRTGVYESGDFVDHVIATIEFVKPLQDGILLPRLTSMTCGGYTCPDLIFHYLSPHYLMAFFHAIGFSYIWSEKMLMIVTFILSGVGMYLLGQSFTGVKGGLVAGIMYLYAPYHLVDLHFRTDVGELVCFALLPFLFWLVKLSFLKKKEWIFLILPFLVALLIISHQAISYLSLPILLGFGFITWRYKRKTYRDLLLFIASLISGVLLTAFYWLPIMAEKQFIVWGSTGETSFVDLWDLLYSQWRYGLLFQGPEGQLSHLIGYAQLLTVGTLLFFMFKKRIPKRYLSYSYLFLSIFFIFFLLMQAITKDVWHIVPFLSSFGFSYRLLVFESFFCALMAAIIMPQLKNYFLIFLCSLAILSTILNWGNRRMVPETTDMSLLQLVTVQNPGKNNITLPIWVKGDYYWKPGRAATHLDVLSGETNFRELEHTTNRHEYIINVIEKAQFAENTFYYPGWTLTINGKETAIDYTSDPKPGIMKFILKPGLYNLVFTFKDTFDRTLSKGISTFVLIILILLIVMRFAKVYMLRLKKISFF